MSNICIVRSGGGMPGLDIHAGIWSALELYDIRPSLLCGTSAGAIVSMLQASGLSAIDYEALIRSLSDSDVRSERVAWKLRIPWLDSFLDNAPIRKMLERHCSPTFDALAYQVQAWATDLCTGSPWNVASASVMESPAQAALASMSISGVFPPVTGCDGVRFVDGGVRRNLPLPSDWHRFDHVILCIASERPRDYVGDHSMLTNLIRNIHILMQDQIEDILDIVRNAPNVIVLWPDLKAPEGALRFNHDLIHPAFFDSCLKIEDAIKEGRLKP